jgi:hypothetical protein
VVDVACVDVASTPLVVGGSKKGAAFVLVASRVLGEVDVASVVVPIEGVV